MEADMVIIPDYLIIDEIRRREEQSKHPDLLRLPLPNYDMPDIPPETAPERRPENPPKKGGVIIIDMNSYKRIDTL